MVSSRGEPADQPNMTTRPPGPSRSSAACPTSPPTPSSRAVTGRSPRSPSVGPHAVGPARFAVVHGDVGAEVEHEPDLGRTAGDTDRRRTGVAGRLDEEAADPARRRRDQHDVLGGQVRDLEDAERRATGADHRDRGLGAARDRAARAARSPGPGPARRSRRWPGRGGRRPGGRATPASTPGPVRSTRPATSRPGVIGRSGRGKGPPDSPDRIVVSTRWTPAASTAMRTCPSPGSRSGTSSRTRVSGPPKTCWRMACMASPIASRREAGVPADRS